jgi:uncharacterized Zn-finger protein
VVVYDAEDTGRMDSICCLCLTETESNLLDIPSNPKHSEHVWKVFGVQLNSLGDYPTAACGECLASLEASWNFREQVLNSFACLNIIASADKHPTPALKVEVLEDVVEESVVVAEDLEGLSNDPKDGMQEDILDESTMFVDDTEILDQEMCDDDDEKSSKTTCKQCSKSFPTAHRLKVHEMTHSKEQPFGCPDCPIRFKNERNAKIHHLNIHSKDRPFVCDKCKKSFSRATDLKKHVKTIHVEKPFKCTVCGRCFATEEILDKHQQQHMAKSLVECNVCSVSFMSQAKLDEHRLTHGNDVAQFETISVNQCDICKKNCESRSALLNHKVTHSEDRPFKCPHCELSFKVRSALLAHEKVVHMRVMPHQCPICSKGHSRKSNLAKHMKTHSKMERAATSFLSLENENEEDEGPEVKHE